LKKDIKKVGKFPRVGVKMSMILWTLISSVYKLSLPRGEQI